MRPWGVSKGPESLRDSGHNLETIQKGDTKDSRFDHPSFKSTTHPIQFVAIGDVCEPHHNHSQNSTPQKSAATSAKMTTRQPQPRLDRMLRGWFLLLLVVVEASSTPTTTVSSSVSLGRHPPQGPFRRSFGWKEPSTGSSSSRTRRQTSHRTPVSVRGGKTAPTIVKTMTSRQMETLK